MPRKRGKNTPESEKPTRRSHRSSRAKKSPEYEESDEEILLKSQAPRGRVSEPEESDASSEEAQPVSRRRRGVRAAVAALISDAPEKVGGRKIRLRRTRAGAELTQVTEDVVQDEPPRRSRRTRTTRRGQGDSESDEQTATAVDAGSPAGKGRKTMSTRAANMSPIATKLSRTPSGHWLVCPSTTEPEEDDDEDESSSKPSPKPSEQPASTTCDKSPVSQKLQCPAKNDLEEPSPPTLQKEEVRDQEESSDLPPPVLQSRVSKKQESSSSSSSSPSSSSSSDESDSESEIYERQEKVPSGHTSVKTPCDPASPADKKSALLKPQHEELQVAQAESVKEILKQKTTKPDEVAVTQINQSRNQVTVQALQPAHEVQSEEDTVISSKQLTQGVKPVKDQLKSVKQVTADVQFVEEPRAKVQGTRQPSQDVQLVQNRTEHIQSENGPPQQVQTIKQPNKEVQSVKESAIQFGKIDDLSLQAQRMGNVAQHVETAREHIEKPENVQQNMNTGKSSEQIENMADKTTKAETPEPCDTNRAVSQLDRKMVMKPVLDSVLFEEFEQPVEKILEIYTKEDSAKAQNIKETKIVDKFAIGKNNVENVRTGKNVLIQNRQGASKAAKEHIQVKRNESLSKEEGDTLVIDKGDSEEEEDSEDEVTTGKRQSEEARRRQAKQSDRPSRSSPYNDRKQNRSNRPERAADRNKETFDKTGIEFSKRSSRSLEKLTEKIQGSERQKSPDKVKIRRSGESKSPLRDGKGKENKKRSPSPRQTKSLETKRHEKVSLKRNRIDSVDCGKTSGEAVLTSAIDLGKDTHVGAPSKKRRWGSSQLSRTKTQTVAISTDVLKNIIPDAKPVPEDEVKLLLEDDHGKQTNKESRGAEALDKLRDMDGSQLAPVEAAPMLPAAPLSPPSQNDTEQPKGRTVRKISILQDDARTLQKSPSPPRHAPTSILHITNLVRPFTLPQLKELLCRTGTIIDVTFWIDKIKSRCLVQFTSEEDARATRHALHGVRWPISNPKRLNVDFASPEMLEKFSSQTDTDNFPSRSDNQRVVSTNGTVTTGDACDWQSGTKAEISKGEERPVDEEQRRVTRRVKVDVPIREWDLHKIDQSEEDNKLKRFSSSQYDDLEGHRAHKRSASPPPGQEIKKKCEEGAAKLLDDLFRKTKTAPCIYWLPLSPEQIAEKEEMRRAHMAEHERRLAEMKRADELRLMRVAHKPHNSRRAARNKSTDDRLIVGRKTSTSRSKRSSRSASPKK